MKPKTPLLFALASTVAFVPGCVTVKTESPPVTTVTSAPAVVVPARTTVVSALPSGYRSKVYRGTTYYYYRDTYYRANPGGGYVVVERPW